MTSNNFKPAGKTAAFARSVILCLLLVAVTLAVYWPVMRCDFVNYDDPDYFTSNTHVLAGLTPGNVAWAFTTGHTSNWHPLTWLSLMLDVELFGPGPAGSAPHQPVVSSGQHGAAFSVAPATDRRRLAERVGGGAVCPASVARGIGGVDCGAQGCFEHVFRAAGVDCSMRAMRRSGRKSRNENRLQSRNHRLSTLDSRPLTIHWRFCFSRWA